MVNDDESSNVEILSNLRNATSKILITRTGNWEVCGDHNYTYPATVGVWRP
jgi:hypothetical protein